MREEQATATAAHSKSNAINSTLNTPNLEGRVAEVLPRISSPAGKRILEFVAAHPGAWTYEISRECACANVSDAVMRMRSELDRAGIHIFCYLPKREGRLNNRFGEESRSHRWQATTRNRGLNDCGNA